MNRETRSWLAAALAGLSMVACKGGGGSGGEPATLFLSPTPNRIRPDGMVSDLRVTALAAGGSLASGDVTLQASCGTISGADAVAGVTVPLRGGIAAPAYSCNGSKNACCTDGASITVTATLGDLTATRTVKLDAKATGGGGGSTGGGGSGGGGGTDTFQFDVAPFSTGEVAVFDTGYLSHLDKWCEPAMGFHGAEDNIAWFVEGGSFYYIHNGPATTLRRFVADSWEAGATSWTYPSDVDQNDPVIPTTPCSQGPRWFVPQQGSTNLLYTCNDTALGPVYDQDGTQRIADGVTPISWNANGVILVVRAYQLAVVGTDGTETTVSNPQMGSWEYVRARAHGDGFWAVDWGEPSHRWSISATGVATDDGAFADLPAGYSGQFQVGALDDSGNLYRIYQHTVGSSSYGAVIRFPLAPGTAEVVHDDATDPRGDATTAKPTACPLADLGTLLVAFP